MAIVFVSTAPSTSADAYRYTEKCEWDGACSKVLHFVGPNSKNDAFEEFTYLSCSIRGDYASKLVQACDNWNAVGGAVDKFSCRARACPQERRVKRLRGNGVSEAFFVTEEGINSLKSNEPIAFVHLRHDELLNTKEADLAFTTPRDYPYREFSQCLGFQNVPVEDKLNTFTYENVSAHELGHVLGMGHEQRFLNVMQTAADSSGLSGHEYCFGETAFPTGDDSAGVRAAYPNGQDEYDVATSPFETRDGGARLKSHPAGVSLMRCPGDTLLYHVQVSNRGTQPLSYDRKHLIQPEGVLEIAPPGSLVIAQRNSRLQNPGSHHFGGLETATFPSDIEEDEVYVFSMLLEVSDSNTANNGSIFPEPRVKYDPTCP